MKHPRFDLRPVMLAICFSAAAVSAAEANGKAAPSEFKGMDADRDGRISASEHAAATQRMFEAMDADKGGQVTAAEMDAAREKITGKKSSDKDMTSAEKIKVIDTDGDGVLTTAEHAAGSHAMFAKMDADKDGYLSKAEWTAGHAALMKKPAQ